MSIPVEQREALLQAWDSTKPSTRKELEKFGKACGVNHVLFRITPPKSTADLAEKLETGFYSEISAAGAADVQGSLPTCIVKGQSKCVSEGVEVKYCRTIPATDLEKALLPRCTRIFEQGIKPFNAVHAFNESDGLQLQVADGVGFKLTVQAFYTNIYENAVEVINAIKSAQGGSCCSIMVEAQDEVVDFHAVNAQRVESNIVAIDVREGGSMRCVDDDTFCQLVMYDPIARDAHGELLPTVNPNYMKAMEDVRRLCLPVPSIAQLRVAKEATQEHKDAELLSEVFNDNCGLVNELLGARANPCNPELLCRAKSPEILAALISAKADPNALYQGRTPVEYAAKVEGSVRKLEALVAAGADVNRPSGPNGRGDDGCGNVLFKCLYLPCSAEIIEALVASKADLNCTEKAGRETWTPLSLVVSRQDGADAAKMIAALAAAKADVNWKDWNGKSIVQLARKKNKDEVIAALLAAKADPN